MKSACGLKFFILKKPACPQARQTGPAAERERLPRRDEKHDSQGKGGGVAEMR